MATIEERVSEIEKRNFKYQVYTGAVALALLVVFSLTWVSIPNRAKAAAEEAAKEVAGDIAITKAAEVAKTKAEEIIGSTLLQEIADQATVAAKRADAASSRANTSALGADSFKAKAESTSASLEQMHDIWKSSDLPRAITDIEKRLDFQIAETEQTFTPGRQWLVVSVSIPNGSALISGGYEVMGNLRETVNVTESYPFDGGWKIVGVIPEPYVNAPSSPLKIRGYAIYSPPPR